MHVDVRKGQASCRAVLLLEAASAVGDGNVRDWAWLHEAGTLPRQERPRTARTQSRSCWDLSPWMESAGQPSVRSWRVTASQPRLVSQKMSRRRPSISRSSSRVSVAYLSASPMNSKACSIMWLACAGDTLYFCWPSQQGYCNTAHAGSYACSLRLSISCFSIVERNCFWILPLISCSDM